MNMDVKKDCPDGEQIEVCEASESTYEEFAKELEELAKELQEIADASDFDAVIIPRLAEDIPPEALMTNKLDGNKIANMLENNLNNFISESYPVPSPNDGMIFASHASVSYNGDDGTGTMSFSVSYTLREDEGVCTFQSSVKRPDERS